LGVKDDIGLASADDRGRGVGDGKTRLRVDQLAVQCFEIMRDQGHWFATLPENRRAMKSAVLDPSEVLQELRSKQNIAKVADFFGRAERKGRAVDNGEHVVDFGKNVNRSIKHLIRVSAHVGPIARDDNQLADPCTADTAADYQGGDEQTPEPGPIEIAPHPENSHRLFQASIRQASRLKSSLHGKS
jgi:hypothetical protein